ncbi:MAG: hypothetical protein HY074_05595 [Deltaproteobacteria bacterium]|nr:hypothetical protein [Deltaproteobacteria bacterium]
MKAANFLHSCIRSLLYTTMLAAALACLMLASCVRKANVILAPVPIKLSEDGKPPVPLVPRAWHRVAPGMGKEDVIHFVGEPNRRVYDGHFQNGREESWYYDAYDLHNGNFDPHLIRFQDGRVIYEGFDEARFKEKRKEETAEERKQRIATLVPPDVGFHCEENSQCESKSCIGNRCAGPRGCTRPTGAECTSDLDCCSMHCNQGGRVCN